MIFSCTALSMVLFNYLIVARLWSMRTSFRSLCSLFFNSHLLYIIFGMANTNRTNPHSSSPVSRRRSARNKSGDAPPRSTAARASKKKNTQTKKGQETCPPDSDDDADYVQCQRKAPPELLPGAVLLLMHSYHPMRVLLSPQLVRFCTQ